MSRINNLREKLKGLQMAREDLINGYDRDIAETVEQIAALEKKASQPREFNAYVDDNGKLTTMPCKDLWRGHAHNNEPITVREVKPIVVTRENAERFFSYLNSFDITRQEKLIGALNYIGIDAEPSND